MTMPHWAKIGARVVCIDDDTHIPTMSKSRMDGLTKGEVYTITWVGMHSGFPGVSEPGPSIHVAGLRTVWQNSAFVHFSGYDVARFRPLVEKTQEQDVEDHFEKLLRVGEQV